MRTPWKLLPLAFLCLTGLACAQTTKATSQPTSQPKITHSEESTAFKAINALYNSIPKSVKNPKKITGEQVRNLVDNTLKKSYDYLSSYPQGNNRVDVIHIASRLLTMNNKRRETLPVQAWRGANLSEYWGIVRSLVADARKHELTPAQTLAFFKVEGQIAYHNKQYAAAQMIYKNAIDKFPNDADADETAMSYLNVTDKLRQYEACVRDGRKFIERFPKSVFYPSVIGLLATSYSRMGDAENVVAVWMEFKDRIINAAQRIPVDVGDGEMYVYEKKGYESFRFMRDQLFFQIAFHLFVQGKLDEAREWMQKSVDDLNERQAELSQAGKVFLSRADRVLNTMKTLVGKPSPSCDVGDGWRPGLSLDVAKEKGNVVALYFTTYDNKRYEDFLNFLQSYHDENRGNGFRSVWLSIPKRKKQDKAELDKFDVYCEEKGIGMPGGLDLEKGWPVYNAFNCAVGGGSLVVVDRSGNVVWYKMDPTFRDIELARGLFDRLLSSSP